ncbi:DnaJ subfamily B member 9 [Paramecium bursaria]
MIRQSLMRFSKINQKNYYNILGVSQTASFEEIKQAYIKKAKELHPQVNSSVASFDIPLSNAFQDVAEAYAVLSQQKSRNTYDILRKELPELLYSENRQQQVRNDDGTYDQPGQQASEYAQKKMDYLKKEREIFNVDDFGHYKGGLPQKDKGYLRGGALGYVGELHYPEIHHQMRNPFQTEQFLNSDDAEEFNTWASVERNGKEWSYLHQTATVDFDFFKFEQTRSYWRLVRNFFIFAVIIPYYLNSIVKLRNRYLIQDFKDSILNGTPFTGNVVLTETGTLRIADVQKKQHH